jgi:hypothetical protein
MAAQCAQASQFQKTISDLQGQAKNHLKNPNLNCVSLLMILFPLQYCAKTDIRNSRQGPGSYHN